MNSETDPPYFFIDARSGKGSVEEGVSEDMDVALEFDKATFINVFRGKVSATKAFFERDLRVKGDMGKAMGLSKIVKKLRR